MGLSSDTAVSPDPIERVTAVIVTYNSAHCIAPIAPLLNALPHVIFSDNASMDGTVETIESLVPQAKVLRHGQNLGFGAANNRALALIDTDFALLINPDCTISAASLRQLVKTADAIPDASIIGPQIVDGQGRPEVNYRWATGAWASSGPAAEGPACVGFLSGSAMLIRLSVAQPAGFFDERFFLYYEDDDLCRRYFSARRPLVIEPLATAQHLSRRSVGGKGKLKAEYLRGYHHAQSKLAYAEKYDGIVDALRLRRRTIWQTAASLPLRALVFSPRLLARMMGRMHGLAKWSGR